MSNHRAQGDSASSGWAWTRRVLDARGVAVGLIDIGHPKNLFPWWAGLPGRDLRRVVRRVPSPAWLWALTIALGLLLGCAGAWYFVYRAWLTVTPPTKPFAGSRFLIEVAMVLLVVGWIMRYGWLRFGSPIRIVRAFLAERLCPTCAHTLESLPIAADGCTICPECGSAWRVDPPGDVPDS